MCLVLLAASCGPAPRGSGAGSIPSGTAGWSATAPRFEATGRARFTPRDGAEIDGRVAVRVDPPARVWVEMRGSAVFGLVGDRQVLAAPGDGWLVTLQDRGDRLERLPFEQTWAADLAPAGSLAEILQMACGRLPWPPPASMVPPGLPGGTDVLEYDLPAPARGRLRLLPQDGRLARLEWWVGGTLQVGLDYDRYVACGAAWLPSRVRIVAPGSGVRAEIQFDHVMARDSFSTVDFEVDGNLEGR